MMFFNRAIDEEIRLHPEAERFIGPGVQRLRSLIMQLLNQLLQLLYKRQLHITMLDGILFPSETETTVCEVSPIKVGSLSEQNAAIFSALSKTFVIGSSLHWTT
jgi:hypothetical protein